MALTSTLDDLIAGNIKLIRGERGLSQHDLAERARAAGLPWTQGTVASIETGKRKVTKGEMLLLQHLLGAPLPILLQADEDIDLGGVLASSEGLDRLARGDTSVPVGVEVKLRWSVRPSSREEQRLAKSYGQATDEATLQRMAQATLREAERKAPKSLAERYGLDVSAFEVVLASHDLWGRSLSDERDARLAEGSDDPPERRRALRGHATRELFEELKKHMESRRRTRKRRN
ncbi:MAG: helix-turn-helix transcriptional regulator [Actinomycetota bacterium]